MPVKISDLLPKKIAIDTGNGILQVGPINLEGITSLIHNFKEPLIKMLSTSVNNVPNFMALSSSAPDMVVAMIALGSDAVGQEDDIKQLPMGVQVTAAAEIWALSVPDAKKLLSVLSTVLAQLKPDSVPATPFPPIPSVEPMP